MQIDTWNSLHPLDEERFHEALKRIFSKSGTNIDEEDFEEVLTTLIIDLHSSWGSDEKIKHAKLYSKKAAHIASYLHDIL